MIFCKAHFATTHPSTVVTHFTRYRCLTVNHPLEPSRAPPSPPPPLAIKRYPRLILFLFFPLCRRIQKQCFDTRAPAPPLMPGAVSSPTRNALAAKEDSLFTSAFAARFLSPPFPWFHVFGTTTGAKASHNYEYNGSLQISRLLNLSFVCLSARMFKLYDSPHPSRCWRDSFSQFIFRLLNPRLFSRYGFFCLLMSIIASSIACKAAFKSWPVISNDSVVESSWSNPPTLIDSTSPLPTYDGDVGNFICNCTSRSFYLPYLSSSPQSVCRGSLTPSKFPSSLIVSVETSSGRHKYESSMSTECFSCQLATLCLHAAILVDKSYTNDVTSAGYIGKFMLAHTSHRLHYAQGMGTFESTKTMSVGNSLYQFGNFLDQSATCFWLALVSLAYGLTFMFRLCMFQLQGVKMLKRHPAVQWNIGFPPTFKLHNFHVFFFGLMYLVMSSVASACPQNGSSVALYDSIRATVAPGSSTRVKIGTMPPMCDLGGSSPVFDKIRKCSNAQVQNCHDPSHDRQTSVVDVLLKHVSIGAGRSFFRNAGKVQCRMCNIRTECFHIHSDHAGTHLAAFVSVIGALLKASANVVFGWRSHCCSTRGAFLLASVALKNPWHSWLGLLLGQEDFGPATCSCSLALRCRPSVPTMDFFQHLVDVNSMGPNFVPHYDFDSKETTIQMCNSCDISMHNANTTVADSLTVFSALHQEHLVIPLMSRQKTKFKSLQFNKLGNFVALPQMPSSIYLIFGAAAPFKDVFVFCVDILFAAITALSCLKLFKYSWSKSISKNMTKLMATAVLVAFSSTLPYGVKGGTQVNTPQSGDEVESKSYLIIAFFSLLFPFM